ncbi:MAG TPA: hypothetical protein VHN14_01085 [Kofleriaceae bacterium]|jgi:hypothetical protein|nr:hypothetical protein [Kofleriaceae bacterium]
MKWLAVLALVGACGASDPLPATGGVSLVLDIPNGALDPKGYTTVEVVLHGPKQDINLSANIDSNNTFKLADINLADLEPSKLVSIEATLRNNSGAAVGYGRTAVAMEFIAGATIVVPMLRPITYISGTVSRDADGNPNTTPLHWTEAPATFSDLSVGMSLDGRTQVGGNAVLMIAAGPALYMVTQATSDPSGLLTGPARVMKISTVDHQVGPTLNGTMTGGVIDGAGADDGTKLVIGTTTQLFVVNTSGDTAVPLADGNFGRVALLTPDTGDPIAIAIANRGSTIGPCPTSAELWWAPLTGGPAHRIATGGFSDIATDRGQAYYVDACKGEFGKITEASILPLRSIPDTGPSAGTIAGKPTALAVSNDQAYIGIEHPQAGTTSPATTSLLVMSTQGSEDPRTLWIEGAQQVLDVMDFPDVRRQLDASSVVFAHLEIGAGGDYVALTTSAHFHGASIPQVGIPDMTIDTEELRVFDAATGGIVQRYRSWCDGIVLLDVGDISGWECAAAAGQSAPAADSYEHHINSMTFLFGKK